MTVDTFYSLCNAFGDQAYDATDRWKSIKYISTEGQMEPIDFEFFYNNRMGYFLGDENIGYGFILLETPYTEFTVLNYNKNGTKKKIVTFVGLDMVNGISFRQTDQNRVSDILSNA